MTRKLLLCAAITLIACVFQVACAFTMSSRAWALSFRRNVSNDAAGSSPTRLWADSESENSNERKTQQQQSPMSEKQKQELLMEKYSLYGAKKIASMPIPERTKRAMLAEVVEDRIFDLTTELEELIKRNNNIVDDSNKEEALEIATKTKSLQHQYQDLVSGKPSLLINELTEISERAEGKEEDG